MIKEIVMHEIPVALIVLVREPQIFVHIEGHHVCEGDLPCFILCDQLLVNTDR